MTTQYVVTGACATVQVDTSGGLIQQMLYQGSPVPPGVDPKHIEHLLSVKLIAKSGTDEAEEAANPVVTPEPGADTDTDKAAAELEAKRAEARAKLPTDGSLPHPNAGQPVWVEAAVRASYSYEEASKQDKADLQELLKPKS